MFFLAILIVVYSYTLFTVGLIGQLYASVILFITVFFYGVAFAYAGKQKTTFSLKNMHLSLLEKILIAAITLQVLINVIGVFGPELAFDALWYHLTLPKLYLLHHKVYFIPGGLLYYSAMPQLAEMLYVGALSLGNEITAKAIHFLFGIGTLIGVYKLSRLYISRHNALLTVFIFYSNLVVGWESITAYIDLTRSFFEVLGVFALILWTRTDKRRYFFLSAIFIGAAIATKLLAVGTLSIMVVLLLVHAFRKQHSFQEISRTICIYIFCTLSIPFPWFLFSFLNTGNPVYPFFTSLYPVTQSFQILNPLHFLRDIVSLFVLSPDPVSPVYLICVPLFFLFFPKGKNTGLLWVYSGLSLLVWFITPRTGGGRFIVPYLPVLSLCIGLVVEQIQKEKILIRYVLLLILTIGILSIVYRGIANVKYISVITGRESKHEFLTKQLNFSYGDFYDTDGYFARTIGKEDRVLLRGFHNLYYIDFPYVHESWITPHTGYTYIALQGDAIPDTLENTWHLVYKNKTTHVGVYKKQ